MCGRCADAPPNPENLQPKDSEVSSRKHTADMVFFKVAMVDGPDADTLKSLIASQRGQFCDVDLFDGKEHNYMEIGAWIGDQGLALQFMALGNLLGLWKLLTPKELFGNLLDDSMVQRMVGSGLLSIMAPKKE